LLANAGGSDSLAILESVLRQDPENSAANHYYIHALEFTDLPERALHSADILGRLAPSSAHMVHMPGHIYFRVGDYARAAQAFAAALAVDKRYMGEQHVEPDNNWNYVHNLMYSIANLLEQGKFDAATSLSADITGARGKLDTTLYPHMARDSISQGGTYGLGGAAAGPLGVRAALGGAQWRMMAECCLDMGDVPFFPGVPLDEMLAAEVVGQARAARYGTSAGELPLCVLSIHRSIAVAAAAAGMRVLSLGGDHSITAAALLGIQRLDVSVIHVDSHADLSTGRDGLDLLHSTWIHYVDQRSHLPLVIQIGVPILGGHPKPAIEGHFKTGQR
jgi:hypothetical protein